LTKILNFIVLGFSRYKKLRGIISYWKYLKTDPLIAVTGIKGIGSGEETSYKVTFKSGYRITEIKELRPIIH